MKMKMKDKIEKTKSTVCELDKLSKALSRCFSSETLKEV